ncbi:hypothetical protein ABK040_008478 [Willaertia magna]
MKRIVLLVALLILAVDGRSLAQLIFSSLPFPTANANFFKPAKSPYYALLPCFDSEKIDFCKPLVDQSPRAVKSLLSMTLSKQIGSNNNWTTSHMTNIDCANYFCFDKLSTANFTSRILSNEIFRIEFSFLFNHCMFCNSNSSITFRNLVENGSCNSFPFVPNNWYQLGSSHCQGKPMSVPVMNVTSSESLNYRDFHFAVLDAHLFEPLSIYSGALTKSISKLDNNLDTISRFFNTLYNNTVFGVGGAPMFCHCASSNTFAFKCYDSNHNFFLPLKFNASPLLFLALFLIVTIVYTIVIIVPKLYVIIGTLLKLKTFKKDVNFYFTTKFKHPCLSFTKAILLLTIGDIKVHVIFWAYLFNIFLILTEIFSYARNYYSAINIFFIDDVGGSLRAIGMLFLLLAYGTMVIHWQHTMDLFNANTTKANLSKINTIILIVFYVFVAIALLAGIIGSAITKDTFVIFGIFSALYIIIGLVFSVAFTILGVRILLKMKKTSKSIAQLKLTKSIMLLNICNLVVVIIAVLSLPTYLIGFDIYTIEMGLIRSTVYDLWLLSVSIVSFYVLFTPFEFGFVYGKKAADLSQFLLNCEYCGNTTKNTDESSSSAKDYNSSKKKDNIEKIKHAEMTPRTSVSTITSEANNAPTEEGTNHTNKQESLSTPEENTENVSPPVELQDYDAAKQ